MRTRVTCLLAILALSITSCVAQRTIRVEAMNNDISNNLDLQAVASIFGDSRTLEDFERRLNDYDSHISNLDLNNDGEVDYLRVVESMENNVHVIVIQAILDRNVFQDVATIVVERTGNRRAVIQIIGNPYFYGVDYIIEPVYYYRPLIYTYFWSRSYRCWESPYYWGYYPRHYRHYHPYEINLYFKHVHSHINHDHRYYYSNTYRNSNYQRLQQSIRRSDYETRYPDRSFTRRNASINANSKRDFDKVRENNTIYERRTTNTRVTDNAGSRSVQNRNAEGTRSRDDVYQNRSTRSESPERRSTQGSGTRTEDKSSQGTRRPDYSAPASKQAPASGSYNDTRSTRPDGSRNTESSVNNAGSRTVTRDFNPATTPGQSNRQVTMPERRVIDNNRNIQPSRTTEGYRTTQPFQQRPAAVSEPPRSTPRVSTESGSRSTNVTPASRQTEQRKAESPSRERSSRSGSTERR